MSRPRLVKMEARRGISLLECDVDQSLKDSARELIRFVGHDPDAVLCKPGMSLILEWGKRCEAVITYSTLMIQLRNRSGNTVYVATMDRKTMGEAHIRTAAGIVARCRKLKADPEVVINLKD